MVPLENNCSHEPKVPEVYSQTTSSTADPNGGLEFVSPSSLPSTSGTSSWNTKGRHPSGCVSDSDQLPMTPELSSLHPSLRDLPTDFIADRFAVEMNSAASQNLEVGTRPSFHEEHSSFSNQQRVPKLEETRQKWTERSHCAFPVPACLMVENNSYSSGGDTFQQAESDWGNDTYNFCPNHQQEVSSCQSIKDSKQPFLHSGNYQKDLYAHYLKNQQDTELNHNVSNCSSLPNNVTKMQKFECDEMRSPNFHLPSKAAYPRCQGNEDHRHCWRIPNPFEGVHDSFEKRPCDRSNPAASSATHQLFAGPMNRCLCNGSCQSDHVSSREMMENARNQFKPTQLDASPFYHRKDQLNIHPESRMMSPRTSCHLPKTSPDAEVNKRICNQTNEFEFRQPSHPISLTTCGRKTPTEGMFICLFSRMNVIMPAVRKYLDCCFMMGQYFTFFTLVNQNSKVLSS